jgi:mono/diheme cytochrome c family protein
MPSFSDILNPEEIDAVVQHVERLSAGFSTPSKQIAIPARIPSSSESIRRGRLAYAVLRCDACHGEDGRLWKTFEDSKGYPVRSRDLTAPWTFRGGSSPEELWLRLTTGVGVMPSYQDASTPEERWDIVNYLISIGRIAAWDSGGSLDGPGQSKDPLARGDYLIRSEMCGLCHTQINRTGIYRDQAYLAGGMRVGLYPHGYYVSRNLTGDVETGIGAWTEQQLVQAFTNGQSPDRTLNVVGMPWAFLHRLTGEDARAIAAALKALPPVTNLIPPPLRYGVLETIAVKLTLPLPAAVSKGLTYAEGNFGNRRQPERIPRLLTRAQQLVLALGLILFFFARTNGTRRPRTVRSWVLSVVLVLAVATVIFVGWILYELPALSFIPADQISSAVLKGLPSPTNSSWSPERRALVERGKYLYAVTSCTLCHGVSGAAGSKISWRPMGTLWARNITSDLETGIGSWTDRQIARAIRSGLSKDGRQLHWQGMIWDHLSNLDEEDIAALVSYLRALPPVKHAIPAPAPPSVADCEVYTFFPDPQRTERPGCE